VIKTNNARRFGGYASVDWESSCGSKKDNRAFLFSFDEKKKIINDGEKEKSIRCLKGYGPIWGTGDDLCINQNYKTEKSYSVLKCAYGVYDKTIWQYALATEKFFTVKNLEVYKVID
jgi:hypothetical protein